MSSRTGEPKRNKKRVKMVLAVRVCGVDGSGKQLDQLVHTTDITFDGARIAGLRTPLAKGQSVTIHRGGVKRTFRVIWVQAAANEYQVGLQGLEPLNELWKLDLPHTEDDYGQPGKASSKAHA
jgi:hypothetical protein